MKNKRNSVRISTKRLYDINIILLSIIELSVSHNSRCKFRVKKKESEFPQDPPFHFFLLLMIAFIIKVIITAHTITSPKTIITAAPPMLKAITVTTTNMSNISAKNVNNSITLISFHNIVCKLRVKSKSPS